MIAMSHASAAGERETKPNDSASGSHGITMVRHATAIVDHNKRRLGLLFQAARLVRATKTMPSSVSSETNQPVWNSRSVACAKPRS